MRSLEGLCGVALIAIGCGGTAGDGSAVRSVTGAGGGGAGGDASTRRDGGSEAGRDACPTSTDFLSFDIGVAVVPGDAGFARAEGAEFEGIVATVAPDRFTLNTCPAMNVACRSDPPVTVAISASGLDLTSALAVGMPVNVHWTRKCFYSCTESVIVGNAKTAWEVPSTPAPAGFFVAAVLGGVSAPEEAPFTVEYRKLDCAYPSSWNCGGDGAKVGAYSLQFTDTLSGTTTDVPMGVTTHIVVRGAPVAVRDLRSFETGTCDAGPDVDWWAASALPTR